MQQRGYKTEGHMHQRSPSYHLTSIIYKHYTLTFLCLSLTPLWANACIKPTKLLLLCLSYLKPYRATSRQASTFCTLLLERSAFILWNKEIKENKNKSYQFQHSLTLTFVCNTLPTDQRCRCRQTKYIRLLAQPKLSSPRSHGPHI